MCLLHFKLQLMQQEQTAELGYIQISAFACEKLTCNVCLGLWFFFSHLEYQLVSFLYVCSFIPTSLNFILLEFATNFRLLIARLQNGRGFSVKRRIWLVIKPIFVVLNMMIWVVFEANKGQPCTLHQSNITWPGCGGFLYKNELFKSQNEILDVCIHVNLLIYFSTLKSVRFAFITDIVLYILCTFARNWLLFNFVSR